MGSKRRLVTLSLAACIAGALVSLVLEREDWRGAGAGKSAP